MPPDKSSLEINLGESAPTTFFLIHGYTGSPTDFNQLPQYLHETFEARVKVMLLPGHGTTISDLDHVHYDEIVAGIELDFIKEWQDRQNIIVGGISFGALMALRLAARYPVQGVINIGIPYRFKLPFSLPGVKLLRFYKKHWKKKIAEPEQLLRSGSFHYPEMHINGLAMVKRARREITRNMPHITCPVLTVHSTSDPLAGVHGVRRLQKHIKAPHDVIIYNNKNHNIFYSNKSDDVCRQIGRFVNQAMLQKAQPLPATERVAAIVPAYNEVARIAPVLEVLANTPIINEVIVIDDGSLDHTAAAAAKIPGVRVLTNKKNMGKAYSLQRGIDATTADILFFCDADLTSLTPEIVSAIVQPVLDGQHDMFIGVRNNLSQKTVTLFALNSGERALRRLLWETMPASFKHRYRIEVGLNITAKMYGKGYGWRKFEYYQTLKEKKYGMGKGTVLRWRMNADVLYAYLLVIFHKSLYWRKSIRPSHTTEI